MSRPVADRARAEESGVRIPHWAMALFLMVALHLFWFIWLTPGAVHVPLPRGGGTRLTFLSGPGEAGSGDARVLWSPILLSLPTPMGFSGGVASESPDVRPTLAAPVLAPHYLERDGYPAPGPSQAGPAAVTPPRTDVSPRAAAPPAVSARGLRISFEGGLAEDLFLARPVPLEQPGWDGPTNWTIEARLAFDTNGTARSVLLEERAGDPALGRRVTQTLRRWTLRPDVAPREGRVVLTYRAPPPDGEGETAP